MTTTTITASTVAEQQSASGKDFQSKVYYFNKNQKEVDALTKDECSCNLYADEYDDPRDVTVHDMRPNIETYSIGRHGFEVVLMADTGSNLLTTDEAAYQKEVKSYLDHLCRHVQFHLGARAVVPFVTQVRPRCLNKADAAVHTPIKKFTVPRPHCDFSPTSMPKIWEQLNIDNDPERWKQVVDLVESSGETPRVQVLGAWKPLSTVKCQPLCLVDPKTVPQDDWVLLPGGKKWAQNGGFWLLHHSKSGAVEHKWFYVSNQTPEELLLFVHEDTDKGAVGRVPHTGLEIPETEHFPDRESVETRLLVVY